MIDGIPRHMGTDRAPQPQITDGFGKFLGLIHVGFTDRIDQEHPIIGADEIILRIRLREGFIEGFCLHQPIASGLHLVTELQIENLFHRGAHTFFRKFARLRHQEDQRDERWLRVPRAAAPEEPGRAGHGDHPQADEKKLHELRSVRAFTNSLPGPGSVPPGISSAARSIPTCPWS
jgi:hypothetical protein